MVAIWEPANKFRIWFEIEAHACDAQADLGVIPIEAAKAVWAGGGKPYTPERIARIDAIEAETKHDVIAFTTELAEQVGIDLVSLNTNLELWQKMMDRGWADLDQAGIAWSPKLSCDTRRAGTFRCTSGGRLNPEEEATVYCR